MRAPTIVHINHGAFLHHIPCRYHSPFSGMAVTARGSLLLLPLPALIVAFGNARTLYFILCLAGTNHPLVDWRLQQRGGRLYTFYCAHSACCDCHLRVMHAYTIFVAGTIHLSVEWRVLHTTSTCRDWYLRVLHARCLLIIDVCRTPPRLNAAVAPCTRNQMVVETRNGRGRSATRGVWVSGRSTSRSASRTSASVAARRSGTPAREPRWAR